jgi:eukaryotic-like serine/threonine-protein kinase
MSRSALHSVNSSQASQAAQPTQAAPSGGPGVSRLGRFYVTRELGRGSVGCVYLAHDPVLGRDLAVKTFRPDLSEVERARCEGHFINEARAMGALAHPHIATIYDASVEKGNIYVAMEVLEGRELDKLLASGRRFSPDEVASICWKIADALAHAHARHVVHRDIKPANIFMVKDDQPKLVDFSIARAPNRIKGSKGSNSSNGNPADGEWHDTLYRPDQLLGTPNYMSPEQAQSKPVDARTDIYSLGAVMYEMLVGVTPFRATTDRVLLQHVVSKTPIAPHEIDARIPAALSRIVMTAMNKRPDRRYPNAEAMAVDIKRYLIRMRRARRRMNIPVNALEGSDESRMPGWLAHSRTYWIAGLGLGVAAALVGARLLGFLA